MKPNSHRAKLYAMIEKIIESEPYACYSYPAQNDAVERERAGKYAMLIARMAIEQYSAASETRRTFEGQVDAIAKAPTAAQMVESARCVVGTTESATTQEMRHAGKPASHAPASSADLVLVPRNPTVEMLTAGAKAADLHSHSPRGIWAAMLAAAGNHERRG